MNCGKLRYVSNCCAKEWNPLFSKHHNFQESRPYLEARREIVRDCDELEVFLQDFDESDPGASYLIQELQEFCQGTSLDDLKSNTGLARQRRAAWLDDRMWCGEEIGNFVREYQNPLTATDLYQILKEPVCKIPRSPSFDHVPTMLTTLVRSDSTILIYPMRIEGSCMNHSLFLFGRHPQTEYCL